MEKNKLFKEFLVCSKCGNPIISIEDMKSKQEGFLDSTYCTKCGNEIINPYKGSLTALYEKNEKKTMTAQEFLDAFSRDTDNVNKVLTKEIHMNTKEFEKGLIALQKLVPPIQLGRKMQVILHYDPQESSVAFKYFKIQD